MAQEVLLSVGLIIVIAAAFAVIARAIKQPPIIAYLFAGVVTGPLALNLIGPTSASSDILQLFAHIGVAFLLFIVGLSLDFRVLKEVGGVAALGGISQIVLTGGLGFFIAKWLGFNSIASFYIAAALAFSSTVVVVKILSDKKEIDTLHGRIALGILILQDFVAAIVLMAVPLVQSSGLENIQGILYQLGVAVALIAVIFVFASLFLTRLMDYLARNQEVLFLFGIAWALLLATAFDYLGFSLEIGALIAGMSLASSKYTLELGGKIKPLRDFFVVLFFVFFGSQLAGGITGELIYQTIILSAFVIIGKPLIVMAILRAYGYRKKTNFLTGTSLAQISEFSLILTLLGFTLGLLTQEVMSLAVLVALVTIGISSYGIYYAHSIFNKIGHLLDFFEGNTNQKQTEKKEDYDVILFGYHRIGYRVLQTLKKMNVSFAVVDYNPKVILSLGKEGVNCIFGDASDRDFLSEIGIGKAKLVISTIPDEAANLAICDRLKKEKSTAAFIATSEQPRMAFDLYNEGVDYVIIPHHLGGDYAAQMIEKFGLNKSKYKLEGQTHRKSLNKGRNSSSF